MAADLQQVIDVHQPADGVGDIERFVSWRGGMARDGTPLGSRQASPSPRITCHALRRAWAEFVVREAGLRPRADLTAFAL
jgi:hypothetical protein